MSDGPVAALGVVLVDLQANGLGKPSFAGAPFAGATVLACALRRLKRCHSVDQWVLSVPAGQTAVVRQLAGPDWRIEAQAFPSPAWQGTARRARLWSLDGWRGGLARTSVFDEESNPAELARLAQQYGSPWVVQVRAESPLVDPELLDGLVNRARQTDRPPPLMYGSIPPGLAGWVFRADFVKELAEQNLHPGFVLGYRAWDPTIELTEQLFAYKPHVAIARLACRLIADNRHSLGVLRRFEAEAEKLDARSLAERLDEHPEWLIRDLPAEIEIEVTTRRGIGHKYLPAADRPDMPVAQFARLVAEYSRSCDLALVTLGGHGDPLSHPDFWGLLQAANQANPAGLAIVTDGLALDDAVVDRLLASSLDVLHVRLDGHTPAAYAAVHGADRHALVVGNVERFLRRRAEAKQSHPLLVVSMVKCRETLGDLFDFYDVWTTRADGALLTPAADFAGQRPLAHELLPIEPPQRRACRRLSNRACIQSDGTVVSCSEDYAPCHVLGNAFAQPIADWWQSGPLADLRRAHFSGRWSENALCGRCRQWHRP